MYLYIRHYLHTSQIDCQAPKTQNIHPIAAVVGNNAGRMNEQTRMKRRFSDLHMIMITEPQKNVENAAASWTRVTVASLDVRIETKIIFHDPDKQVFFFLMAASTPNNT